MARLAADLPPSLRADLSDLASLSAQLTRMVAVRIERARVEGALDLHHVVRGELPAEPQ